MSELFVSIDTDCINIGELCIWYEPVVGLTLESGSDLARRSDKRPAHDATRRQEVSMRRATRTTQTCSYT